MASESIQAPSLSAQFVVLYIPFYINIIHIFAHPSTFSNTLLLWQVEFIGPSLEQDARIHMTCQAMKSKELLQTSIVKLGQAGVIPLVKFISGITDDDKR